MRGRSISDSDAHAGVQWGFLSCASRVRCIGEDFVALYQESPARAGLLRKGPRLATFDSNPGQQPDEDSSAIWAGKASAWERPLRQSRDAAASIAAFWNGSAISRQGCGVCVRTGIDLPRP
jgi:hypothetical protein